MERELKQCFVDVETTGVDPVKNGITQIAGQVVVDGVACESFNWKVRPFERDYIEQDALEVQGIDPERLDGYPAPVAIWTELTRLLGQYVDKYDKTDKFHFIGYNGKFDSDFMRAWFEKCGDQYYGSFFWFPTIDVCTLAGLKLMDTRHELANFKLGTVARHLGIVFNDADLHDAQEDIRLTQKIFELVTGGGE